MSTPTSPRRADDLVEGSSRGLGAKFRLVANKQVKLWKALVFAMFIAGFAAAMTWAMSESYLRGEKQAPVFSESEAAASNPSLIGIGVRADGQTKVIGNIPSSVMRKGGEDSCPYVVQARWDFARVMAGGNPFRFEYNPEGLEAAGIPIFKVERAIEAAAGQWLGVSSLPKPSFVKKNDRGYRIGNGINEVAGVDLGDWVYLVWALKNDNIVDGVLGVEEVDILFNVKGDGTWKWVQYDVTGDPDTFPVPGNPYGTIDEYDLQNALTTAFGLSNGLGYLIFDDSDSARQQTMNMTFYDEVKRRSVECGDIKGIQELYKASGPPTSFNFPLVTVTAMRQLASEARDKKTGFSFPGVIRFSRTGPTKAPLPVAISLYGTASVTSDYEISQSPGNWNSHAVTFPAGAQDVTVTVKAIDDTVKENKETVVFELQPGRGYTISTVAGVYPSATMYIEDNDGEEPNVVYISSAQDSIASEQPSYFGPDMANFLFIRSGSTRHPLVVTYRVGGSATIGEDYQAPLYGSITIPADSQLTSIEVLAKDDAVPEPIENIILTLTDNGGVYSIAPSHASAEVTITDNDSGSSKVPSPPVNDSSSPDYLVDTFTIEPKTGGRYCVGQGHTVSVRIKNSRSDTSTFSRIRVFDQNDTVLWSVKDMKGLSSGEYYPATKAQIFTWKPATIGSYTITAMADRDRVIEEPDEENNIMQKIIEVVNCN